MGGQLLLASVLILLFLFLLPSASPWTGALGGFTTGEESALQFTVDGGEGLDSGGLDSSVEKGHGSDGSGLYVGSDVVRGCFH